MKKIFSIIGIFCLIVLQGCARYNAAALGTVSPELLRTASKSDGVAVVAKALSKEECKRYLDRDVISKGYQPVQLYIENSSDKAYFFSTNRITLPLACPEEVARKVHTSTMGRLLGYSAAAVLATPLLFIPAVIDGYKSSKANWELDEDFSAKAAKDIVISPFSHVNMLLFVPGECMQESFSLTLLDEESFKPKKIVARVKKPIID